MLDILMNSFGLAFVFVTGLLVVLLAVCGILVARMSARDYFRTRRDEPVDWYEVSLPQAPRRATASKPIRCTGERQGQVVVLDAGVPVDGTYLQEELPL